MFTKKTENNEEIGELLEQLESQALLEVRANCKYLMPVDGSYITEEQFDSLPMEAKESAIKVLAGAGLSSMNLNQSGGEPSIVTRLSGNIRHVMACTIFDILNRLENLDGAINAVFSEMTLELQVPLGGKKSAFSMGNVDHAVVSMAFCTRDLHE